MARSKRKQLDGIGWLLSASFILVGCGASVETLKNIAAAGSINQRAPVTTHLEIIIAASPTRVWNLLIDAPSWPKWAPQIESVSAPGPLMDGTSFTWKTGDSNIHSQVQLVEPLHRLSWTGTAFTAKAIHVWELAPQPNGGTKVTVNESMDGPLMKILFSSTELTEADSDWLTSLKREAEQKP